MSATPLRAPDNHSLEQAVHQLSLLLHGEGWPGAKQVAVCELVAQAAGAPQISKQLSSPIERLLPCLDALHEPLLADRVVKHLDGYRIELIERSDY